MQKQIKSGRGQNTFWHRCLSSRSNSRCFSVGLRELRVTGLPWSCLSALVSPTLPQLQLLDLRWCEGIKEAQIKDIIMPPG